MTRSPLTSSPASSQGPLPLTLFTILSTTCPSANKSPVIPPPHTNSPARNATLSLVTEPGSCTRFSETVYITAMGCEFGFGTIGRQAAGAGGL